MRKTEWGRRKKQTPKMHAPDAAGKAAIFAAALCAAYLCFFTVRGGIVWDNGSDRAAVFADVSQSRRVTYAKPQPREEWSVWGYFSELLARVFGVEY